jgi:hypothetical protein
MLSNIRKPRIALLVVFVLTLLAVLSSQVIVSAQPTQALDENWRDSDYGYIARMMDTDQNGNIYVMGFTTVGDYLVTKKFSPAGDLLWSNIYNPDPRLRGVWLAVDSNNDPVVLASIVSGSNADPAGWEIIKYASNGDFLWANSLSGLYADARRVGIGLNDDIYVSGVWFNGSKDAVLMKFDADGGTTWTATFDNGGAVDEPFAMTISPDKNLIGIAGTSGNMFMALMFDTDGEIVWSDTNPNIYPANDVAFDAGNSSFFATGTYFPSDPNPYQMAIVKYDATGASQWTKSYSEGDRTYRVRVDGSGNLVATGIDSNGYIDWMTFKTDADGNLLWSRRYDAGKNNDEIPNMLLLDASDAIYVTGTGGPNPSSGNISYLKGVVAKYNSDGSPAWAVFDDYAGGRAANLGTGDTLASLGFGYLVTTHYTQTGLPELIPDAPTNLTGFVGFDGFNYYVSLSFIDNASNEFWVDIERCTGSGCTDFTKVGQTLGENSTGDWDETVSEGVTYTYRVRALGFMGLSDPSNTIEVTVGAGNPPAAPSSLLAEMNGSDVLLNWQDNSLNEEQFYIERCQGDGCSTFSNVGLTGANLTTWTDLDTLSGESYSYRVRAWNSNGFSGYTNTTTILIPTIPNTAPVLDFISDQTVVEFSNLEFTVTATDQDVPSQSLTFSLEAGSPTGASIDPASGVFSWTPDGLQGPGVYPVTVTVTDDGNPALSDSQLFTITVESFIYRVMIPQVHK